MAVDIIHRKTSTQYFVLLASLLIERITIMAVFKCWGADTVNKVILTALLASAALPFSVAAAEAGNGAAPVTAVAMQATDARTIVVNAPRGRVDTAVFGKRPFMRSPRLSPDGTKVAVMMTKDGVDSL
ncbi:hypothetical protein, partial [Sphingorhabdus sp.]|uniref:hypothetical protein n=1 Tax=Sphingorhabdus sp. TaxID=1902408 RepID=UPI0039BD8DAC